MSPHPVHISSSTDVLSRVQGHMQESRVFILTDERTKKECLPILQKELGGKVRSIPFHIPSGETHKNIETCLFLWRNLAENQASRKDILVNLGGGVIGDIGGFVASTYKRGIGYIQVPTTLLGMVDASIGGKTGVDLDHFKNMVGVIRDPLDVLIHPPFLRTLEREEVLSGFAEVIKHGSIEGGPIWDLVKKMDPLEPDALEQVIEPAVSVKRKIVKEDPFEEGKREVLNLGHTFGHAIETLSLESGQPLKHGETVAAGLILEGWVAHDHFNFPLEDLKELEEVVDRNFERLVLPPAEKVLEVMWSDKKNKEGRLLCTLLAGIGTPKIGNELTPEMVAHAVDRYSSGE